MGVSVSPQPDDFLTFLLRDITIEPADVVLEQALGKELFAVYQELIDSIKNEFGLNPEWRFYKDGKAWIWKVMESNYKTKFKQADEVQMS